MTTRNLTQAYKTARLTRVVLVIFGVYALLLNIALLAVSHYTVVQQEQSQEEFLQLVSSNMLEPPRAYFDFLEFLWSEQTGIVDASAMEDYRQTIDWQLVRSAMESTLRGPIQSAEILTPRGEAIMRAGGGEEEANSVPPDDDVLALILRAFRGETLIQSATPGDPIKRLYKPVMGTLSTEPIAVLRLEASVVDPAQIRRSRLRFLAGIVLTTTIVVVLWVATMRLVRRALEAEREASRADRLRALGTLTAGLSHEIRNPLGIIALQAEELEAIAKDIHEEKNRTQVESLVTDLKSETRRLRDLLEDFLRFTRSGNEEREGLQQICPGSILDQIVRLWSKGLSPIHRKIVYTNTAPDACVEFSEARFRQVAINLLRNADEAIGRKEGEIRISLEEKNGALHFEVADTGAGIRPEDMERIFDPFYTTRNEGTGLGLAIARTFVEKAGGSLSARPGKKSGAVFSMTLPVSPQDRDVPDASSPSR